MPSSVLSSQHCLRKLGPALFEVHLDSLKFEKGTSGQWVEQGLSIVTSPQQWAYSLYSPSLSERGFAGEAVVRIQGEFRGGKLGLAIVALEDSGELIIELAARRSTQWRTIDVPLQDIARAGALVIRNQSDEGPSQATIRSIQVFRPAPISMLSDSVAALTGTSFAMQGLARAAASADMQRYCIVCGQDVESWIPFGLAPSEFGRCIGTIGSNPARLWCPHCGSTDRGRHLLMFFGALRVLASLAGGAVLHIAPEPSLVTAIRSARPRRYVKGDLTPGNSSVEPIDVEHIPYPDQTFELAVCNHTLEHVTDPVRALGELRRILKPGGRLTCQTPYAERLSKTFEEPLLQSSEQRTFLYGQRDHLRTFGRDIAEIIAAAGFAGRLVPHDEIIQGLDPEMLGVNEFEPFFDFVAV